MGAGENLPQNVLCEDGDISHRLFYYSVTGGNTWVSLMQTTTILHLWTPLIPLLNGNKVIIGSSSSELPFSMENMLWVRIGGLALFPPMAFPSFPSGQRWAWFKGKIIYLVTFWQRKLVQRIWGALWVLQNHSSPLTDQLCSSSSRVYHQQPADSTPGQEFSIPFTRCAGLKTVRDTQLMWEKLRMLAMKCSLTAVTRTSASELMGWQPGKPFHSKFHSQFHWAPFF